MDICYESNWNPLNFSFIRSEKKPFSKITRAIHKLWNLLKRIRHQAPLKITLALRPNPPKAKEMSHLSKRQNQAHQPTFLMVDFKPGLSQLVRPAFCSAL